VVIFLRPFFFLHLGALGLFEAGGSQSCYATVANDGHDGGDSSDVDENYLEKVASQLALTAFAWWTWPWFFYVLFFCSEGRK